jgi:hypothetical protein
MGSLQNLHRSLVVDGEPVATGIQPIGDALCHTNPTFALGASLSITHGFTLAEAAARADDARALALAFEDTAGVDAAARFDAVSDEDRDRIRLWKGDQIDIRDPGDSMALFLRLTAYPTPRTPWEGTRPSSRERSSSPPTAPARNSGRAATSSCGCSRGPPVKARDRRRRRQGLLRWARSLAVPPRVTQSRGGGGYCAAIRVKSSSVVSIVGSCLMHSYAGRASVAPTETPFQRHVVRRRDGWNAVVTIDRHGERISA